MNKRILFNLVITLFFILLAIVSIFLNFDYLIGIFGLGILTIILLFGNYYHRCSHPKSLNSISHHTEKRKVNISLYLFFTFLICELAIMGLMLYLNNTISLKNQKVLACLLYASIFCMLLAGYQFESNRFQSSKNFSEVRCFGVAVNPRHPIGRIIYISTFILIVILFCILLIWGPTD
ncbi:hypothetical protein SaSA201_1089 [Streptococcus agalactiae]|nr:hypothetical protein SaSA20_1046 [Streptococcus agalactiae]EJZ03664.1 hypothetical protein M3M_02855 [Streptococcus agalactiae STIR-CD-17]EPU01927.1 hypothetical protein SAG0122_00850 [Streptococcus agalactiae STIR-CD-09]EPU06648.1 hypothetical protein SAG0123_08360 [Streptococcus agalactiae STIR-CD-13]EPW86302.1 hypothetical protein SAG0121_07495 [Streptococcus agalactiae STIR-CD-07]CCQ76503.1 hypothetical protein GBS1219_1044 [Streptococcus agalactiae SS1219]CCQ78300.1 hypothetical prote